VSFSILEIIFFVFNAEKLFREGTYPSILKSSNLFGLGIHSSHLFQWESKHYLV